MTHQLQPMRLRSDNLLYDCDGCSYTVCCQMGLQQVQLCVHHVGPNVSGRIIREEYVTNPCNMH